MVCLDRAVPGPRREGAGVEPCPMCGARDLAPLAVVEGYRYRTCGRCAFAFTRDRPGPGRPAHEDFYARGPAAGWVVDLDFLEPALERLEGGGRLAVLDFGCGDSLAPDLLRERGHRVVGVDVRPPRRPHPDRLTGPLFELPLAPGSFHLVYAFQVFEHLAEPLPVLGRLLALARRDGLVLIHTDMETRERDAAAFADWWYVMPPHHRSFYRHRTFDVFLSRTPHVGVWRDPKTVVLRPASGGW